MPAVLPGFLPPVAHYSTCSCFTPADSLAVREPAVSGLHCHEYTVVHPKRGIGVALAYAHVETGGPELRCQGVPGILPDLVDLDAAPVVGADPPEGNDAPGQAGRGFAPVDRYQPIGSVAEALRPRR